MVRTSQIHKPLPYSQPPGLGETVVPGGDLVFMESAVAFMLQSYYYIWLRHIPIDNHEP